MAGRQASSAQVAPRELKAREDLRDFGMEAHERQRSAEYLEGGSTLERTDVPGAGGAAFRIDGKLTEFKSLQGDKMNHTTGLGRLQEATKKPGVQVIDLDIRTPQGTAGDALHNPTSACTPPVPTMGHVVMSWDEHWITRRWR